jgi:hypothetical protein
MIVPMEGENAKPNGDSEYEAAMRKLEKIFPGAKTIGECLHYHYKSRLANFWRQIPDGDVLERQFLRRYTSWPDWALECAVEVCRVFVPRVRREIISDSFRFFHAFVFEARFDGSESGQPPAFPQLDAKVFGTIVGHFLALGTHLRTQLDELASSGLSSEKLQELEGMYVSQLSEEAVQREMQPHLSKYFEARPTKWVEFSEAMSVAKRKTLDPHGGLKETTATKIYSKILEDWPKVEEMSGPTELCAFLDPVLVGSENDPHKKLDRVKKICSRLKVRFQPIVKG